MEHERIKIRTTLPLIPPIDSREEIHTPRLIIRPPRVSDVPALHKLRIQHEAMKHSSKGADKTLEDTLRSLDDVLPPNDLITYHFFIFERDTGELIGKGGVHSFTGHHFGWPEAGYSFKQETWGKGYATEFLTAFLKSWWSLPRKEAEIEVDPTSLDTEGLDISDTPVTEHLAAVASVDNIGSLNVLKKTGFRRFTEYSKVDTVRAAFKGQLITVAGFLYTAPAKENN
jgi:RimJ/RimL family protein N-acetyltransferase